MKAKEGYKYLALSMVIGFAGLLSGYWIGDVACELFGFFDIYNTKIEGTALDADEKDDVGTSIFWDYFFGQWIYTMAALVLFASFNAGGMEIGMWFLNITWEELNP